jgi:hypothetical protein
LGIGSLRIDGEDKGCLLAIICDVIGPSDEEARQRWSQLMGIISAFLATERLATPDPRKISAEHRNAVQAVTRKAYQVWTSGVTRTGGNR